MTDRSIRPEADPNRDVVGRYIRPQDAPDHAVVGRFFKGWRGDLYFCDSYQRNAGYWMTPVFDDHVDPGTKRTNVSERAIGSSYTVINLIYDPEAGKTWVSTTVPIDTMWRLLLLDDDARGEAIRHALEREDITYEREAT